MQWRWGSQKQPWWKKVFRKRTLPWWKKFRVNAKFRSKMWPALGVVAVVFLVISLWFLADLPSPKKLSSGDFPVSTQILDRNGKLLYEVYADEHRTPVTLAELPSYVPQAALAIEDAGFYKHFGFSVQGIVRAVKNTLFSNKLQGGSTITQQLVKTALLTPERTLSRKIKEAVLTIGTEILYSKDQILEMYLNHIPYGGTAYGIEAAAQRYFGKPARELTLSEASLLAGLPQAPSRYSPFINPENARSRQQDVLRRMAEEKYVTREEAETASQEALAYAKPSVNINAPHFVFYIRNLLEEKYGMDVVERGGLRVQTTLDLDLQTAAQASVSAEVEKLARYKVGNGAALVINPQSGEVLAMVGSKDYFDTEHDGQVNLTIRFRQPGSSIKPLNYVTALQLKKLTASSLLLDIPTCFAVTGQRPYCPKNYDGSFRGPVNFRTALANSLNIPAVKIQAVNTLESFIATASAMGISTFNDPSRYGLSLTLGGGEVTMMDMATAFGTLANQGVKVPIQPIIEVRDYKGNVLEKHDPEVVKKELAGFYDNDDPDANVVGVSRIMLTRILNREPAYIVSDILADNTARSMAFGSNSKLRIKDKTVSVKTGTTNDLRDNWTIGYTPELVVATWVGNNDSTPMNPYLVSGVTGAAPIWNDIMSYILKDREDYPQEKPAGIEEIAICSNTGSAPIEGMSCATRNELFWSERLPDPSSIEKKNIWVFKDTGTPAFTDSADKEAEQVPTDNLELQEHLIMSDPFTKEFCLDCNYTPGNENQGEGEAANKPSYPTVNVSMESFYWDGDFEPLDY